MDLKTKITGELYKSIESGLVTAFKNIYPQYDVTIDYKCDRKENNTRYFNVYVVGETINIDDKIPLVANKPILVDRYNNQQAINFSERKEEEFEKVSQYKAENLDIIRNAIAEVETRFKDKGTFLTKNISSFGYTLFFESNNPFKERLYLYKNFKGHISIKKANELAKNIISEFEKLCK